MRTVNVQPPPSLQDSLRISALDSINKSFLPKQKTDTTNSVSAQISQKIKEKKGFLRQAFLLEPLQINTSPRVAFVRSVIPGWGQATNKQYWKVPFVASAALGGIYAISSNKAKCDYYLGLLNQDLTATTVSVQRYGNIFSQLRFKPKPTGEFVDVPFSAVKTAAESYRRWKEQSVVYTGVGWLLIGVEAYVSAHLKNFDTSNDISWKIQPIVNSNYGYASVGVKLQVTF